MGEIAAKYGTEVNVQYGHVSISAPEVLDLQEAGEATIGFLQTIREVVQLSPPTIGVTMQHIRRMSPTCALLFASEMDRMKRIHGGRHTIPADGFWDPGIKRMLNEIGVFELVGVDNMPEPQTPITAERYISIRSADIVDMERALRSLMTEVAAIATFVKATPKLYGAISEAITNVRQWAYKDIQYQVPKQVFDRWWFLASYNEDKKRFSILVFDHGQGIPATLRRLGWEVLKNFLHSSLFSDADAIEAAFKNPRSATGEKNRGKGLREMRNLLDKFSKGTLRVVSGKGEYFYDCENGGVEKRLYKHDIGGTLVAWEIYESDG
ncbi:hypothetical protein [Asticcacaulis biprosthecium]|nr:hypothetical protein [Asticcacaulis biprosthecium]